MNWINAKDRLPKNGEEVIAYIITSRCPLLNPPFLSIFEYHDDDNGYFINSVDERKYHISFYIIYWVPKEDLDVERLYPFDKDWCC